MFQRQPPPAELRGVWFQQDPEQLQCQRLLQARDPWEHEGSVLIGALWIDDRVLHNWADYGEGDIHQVVRSVQVSRRNGSWRCQWASTPCRT